MGNGPIDRRFNYVFGKAGIHSLPGQAPEAIEGIVHAPLTNSSVRPKPLFWFMSDTETETQIG